MPSKFRSLTDLLDVTHSDALVTMTGRRGAAELLALSNGALRVRLTTRTRMGVYRSEAVLNPPAPADAVSVETGDGAVHIMAGGMTATAQHSPFALSFARANGASIAIDIASGVIDERIMVRKKLQAGEVVYGLGEKTGWLDKRHRKYRMENTDVFLKHPGIGNTTDPMYASYPVFIVHGKAGSYGIFVDNTEFTEFDFRHADEYAFSAPAKTLTYYVLPGPSLPDVVRQYTDLTGRMPLPDLWTLGFHQCRWGYKSEADVREVVSELRAHHIPADAVWCDIDYMDGYRIFTWDKKDFPKPAAFTAELAQEGMRIVTIIDPGVKVDPEYAIYKEAHRKGLFVKHTNGKEYNGSVWPGRSAFPDFHSPVARDWWAGKVNRWLTDYGIAGIWIDMNEPATTDMSGSIEDVWHADGKLPHASARNTYALNMARATYAGILEHNPDSRPFILTRAAFSGAQTVTAQWLGDNSSLWEHLSSSLPMLMNMGLSGMPFVGVDVGGFEGDTNPELLARWTQAGAFYPFFRNHAISGTILQEPWRFGTHIEDICRRATELRYQLLPYLYNLFHEAAQTGAPIMRPLVWHYPRDAATFNLNDEFLFGPDVLVAPVVTPGLSARGVYLPKGTWYRWRPDSDGIESFDGPTHVSADAPLEPHGIPLFVRAGALIPMWPVAQHTGAIDRSGLRLHVWPGKGQLDFYEDDGHTRAYEREDAGSRSTPFRVSTTAERIALTWGPTRGAYADARTDWTFVFHGVTEREVKLDNKPVAASYHEGLLTVRAPDDRKKHTLTLIEKH